jgi:protocatechuate 3,4-dioxygenase beta subunit
MKCFGVLVLMSALLTISARAAVSDIEGDVLDLGGRPLQNTEVQVRQETAPRSGFTFKSDKNGRFSAKGLAPGNYTVTVVVDSETKWTIPHVNAASGRTLHLELKAATDGLDPLAREEFRRLQRPKCGDR